jgi:type VI secretion system protein ImpA
MPSPPTLDIAEILVPIPGENPAGQSVRYDGTYDALREARRADDPQMSQGEWVREIKVADWPAVITQATEVLGARSKDLQVAAWLLEALVKRHGFAGLRDGLHLLWALQEQFWTSLYPEIEDGDLETRVLLLEWVNNNLPMSIRAVPIVQTRDGQNYSWWHWEESRGVDNLGRQNQEAMEAALADGKITGEQFDKALEAMSPVAYQTLCEDLNQGWEEFGRLDQVVDEKFGRDAPSLLEVRKALEDCRTLMGDIGKKKGVLAPAPPVQVPESTPVVETASQPWTITATVMAQDPQHITEFSGPRGQLAEMTLEPHNRADALRRLEALAVYFRQTEPHSPVSYLVQRAVRWGEMPLEAWLQDVINDEGVLSRVRETLGLKDLDGSS